MNLPVRTVGFHAISLLPKCTDNFLAHSRRFMAKCTSVAFGAKGVIVEIAIVTGVCHLSRLCRYLIQDTNF